MSINVQQTSILDNTLSTPKIRKVVLLSDEGNTGEHGLSIITLSDAVFRQDIPQSALLVQRYGPFKLPYPPFIAIDWGPMFHLTFANTSFISVNPAQATGDSSLATPALLIGRIEKTQADMNIDGSDVAASWDLDGGDPQHHRTIQNNFFSLRIIVQSMNINGRPVPNVQFKWALMAEMRFVTITGLDTSNFPNPMTN